MQLLAALGSCSLLATALASVTPLHSIEKYHGETTGRLIVKLKDGASKASLLRQFASSANVTHDWQNFNGFAGSFPHFSEHYFEGYSKEPSREVY